MKKSISINLQGLLFHIEEDGYDILRRYLAEIKQHFSTYAGHDEIVADIESRIAELFADRLTPGKQVITLEDVLAVTAQLGRVSEFEVPTDDEEGATAGASASGAEQQQRAYAGQPAADPAAPRQLFRDESNKKVAGVAAGLGHYFNVNPLWFRLGFVLVALLNSEPFGDFGDHIHVNFGGISFLTYIILWIVMPKRVGLAVAGGPDTRGPGAGRKLFRDTQAGSVGGVAAGLAHYLRVDVTLIRVAFVILMFGFGSGFLLYIVLWIVVPEARSLTDQLEMRGEDVTLSNIASSASADPIGAGRARVVQDNLSSIGLSVAPLFTFLFTAVAWFAGFILLVIAVALLFSTSVVLGIVLGAFPDGGWVQTGDIPVELLRSTLPAWGLVAGFVAALIPTIGLLGLAVRLFTRRPLLSASARLSLFGIWLLAIVGVAAAVGRVKVDFRERAEITTRQPLETDARIVVLDALPRETSEVMEIDDFAVRRADSGAVPSLSLRISARGATTEAARAAAEMVEYLPQVADSVVALPHNFRYRTGAAWRDQEVDLTLNLPADRRYRLTEAFTNRLDNDVYDDRYSRDNKLGQRLFTVEKGRFVLVSGPAAPAVTDNDDEENNSDGDNDIDLNINGERIHIDLDDDDRDGFRLREPAGNAAQRTWNVEDFTALDIEGGYQVRIRKGSTFRVTARGPQRELDDAQVQVRGGKLVVEPEDGFRLSLWGNRAAHEPVLFEVEMPDFKGLDVSGAVRADIAGFNSDQEITLDQSGATWVKLDARSAGVRLDMSGASHTLLTGTTRRLSAEINGASELRARQLTAEEVSVDASGASRATVNAVRELEADASGASRITYYGSPSQIEANDSGASSVRRADDNSSAKDTTDDRAPAAPAQPAQPAAPATPARPTVGT